MMPFDWGTYFGANILRDISFD